MKLVIEGRIHAIDGKKQSVNVLAGTDEMPRHFLIFAADRVFAKVFRAVEAARLKGRKETWGKFWLSGKVLTRFVSKNEEGAA